MIRKRPSAIAPAQGAGSPASCQVERAPAWIFAALFIAMLLAYLPALRGGFLWDDDGHITATGLRSLSGLGRIWFELGATQQYYPVLHSAFWFEHHLWGDSVLGYHLVNVLLHAASAGLLGVILRRLAVPGAWFAAAIFAMHPMHVESVAWISEQKNTLSTFFYLASALIYLRFDEDRNWRRYTVSLVLFALALLTKSVTATLPVSLLIVMGWRRGRLEWKRDVIPLVPWLVIGAGAGILTAWIERHFIGAGDSVLAMTLGERLLLAGRAPWFYAGKLLWPFELAFIYPRWTLQEPASYLALAASVVAVVAAWRWRRGMRGPIAAALFFVVSLFPVLGFLNVYPFIYTFVADHWQYLASIGPIALTGAGAAGLVARIPKAARWFPRAAGAAILCVLALLSARESRGYRDTEIFYETIIARNPTAWMAYNNLGAYYVAQGHQDRGVPLFREALRIKPDYRQAQANLGCALLNLGRFGEAMPHLAAAIQAKDLVRTPIYPVVQANWGAALVHAGREAEAGPFLEEAIRADPNIAATHNALGLAFARLGRVGEAEQAYASALRLQPAYAAAHLNLGSLMAQINRAPEAVVHYEAGLRFAPDAADGHREFAALLLWLGRLDEALIHGEAAVRLEPNSPASHRLLADTLTRMGRVEAAIPHYEQALVLFPDYEGVHTDLAGALLQIGRLGEAFQHCEAALRLKPNDPAALRYLGQIRAKGRTQ